MITYVDSNIFDSPAKVLVNPVNTVGVMGKGLALQFKKLFPEMFPRYQHICERNLFKPGMLWIFKTDNKWVLNFPTKTTWRQPSRVEYIELGLKKFRETYSSVGITSISFPQLGCGNGELDWSAQVQPLMKKYLNGIPIDVFIHLRAETSKHTPEHLDIDEMRNWLRTEPRLLTFEEFWDDLRRAVSGKTLENPLTEEYFSVEFDEIRHGLSFSNGEFVSDEEMMNTWTVVKQYGYLTPRVSPKSDRNFFGNIIGLLRSLQYFQTVRIADDYKNFLDDSDKAIGVQFIPESSADLKSFELSPLNVSKA